MRACMPFALIIVSSMLGSWFAAQIDTVQAAETPVRKEVLRDQLTRGLKATRNDQKAFIDKVVDKYADEELSLRLIYACYRRSIDRRKDYPFPYFQYGITFLAKKQENVDLTED